MKVVLLLLVVMAGVLAQEDPSKSYDVSVDNPPPPPPSQQPGSHNLLFGPPPPPPGGPNFQYGPPPPQSNGPSLMYGPPPPPSSVEYKNKPSYENAFSVFKDDCGYWKALSIFLVVGIALTGLGILFRVWPIPLSLFGDEDTASRLNDPDFISSVYDQIGDLSRILMSIKDASEEPKE